MGPQSIDIFCLVTSIVENALKKKIDEATMFTMSFGVGDKKINTVVVWFLVNVFEMMYSSSIVDPILILERMVNEIDWISKSYNSKYEEAFQILKMEAQMQIISIKFDV